jgi:hypothetical protein
MAKAPGPLSVPVLVVMRLKYLLRHMHDSLAQRTPPKRGFQPEICFGLDGTVPAGSTATCKYAERKQKEMIGNCNRSSSILGVSKRY